MNKFLANIIEAVADNDLKKAKIYAQMIIDNDKTQKNKYFCRRISNKLKSSSMNFIELPNSIKDILKMEDVSTSFNKNRYYLSEREESVYKEVESMYKTSCKLAEMRIQYLNSLVLYGESGTGKTLFGKYIAYKLGLPFVYMNFSNAISSYLGSTAKNISKVFSFIENQKCIFMLDEIDAIGMIRGTEDLGEMARITIALMQALDCIKNDTIIIGATNRIDMIDKALLRRFAIRHEVLRFTREETNKMVIKFLEDVGIKYNESNIESYYNDTKCQADAINKVIKSIAFNIRAGIGKEVGW